MTHENTRPMKMPKVISFGRMSAQIYAIRLQASSSEWTIGKQMNSVIPLFHSTTSPTRQSRSSALAGRFECRNQRPSAK